MAVSEQTPYIEYTANGTATSFALGFFCENQDHLIVLVDDVESVVGAWSLSNGAVVFNTAPENGKKITIQRNTPFSRTTDYQSYNNSFRPPAVNKDFDRVWLKLQELGATDWLLRLYIDRLHGEQKIYIDNLKIYVDDRDDELRAYLLDEIRKQGVALDQLDEYYNYLMQRIAAIAVDKGWDASFIADASGQNQQSLNNGLESIAQLRATNPLGKGFRVYVKSYHPDLNQGGGYFVSTQKNGLVDNGVTIFASQNPLIFWVRSGVREVTPFMAGAKGDRVQDDQPAFMSALSTGLPVKVEKPIDGYRLAAPVSLTLNQVLEGDRERIKVYIDHDGAAFKLTSYGTLKNFEPRAFDVARRFTYDAVVIGESDISNTYISNIIDNIKPFQCKNSFVLRGGAYWNTFTNIDCFQFRDNGIWLVNDGRGKNNNYFGFKQIASNAQADGQGHYSYDEITWDQTCIRVFGNQNTFIGGEHAPAKIGLWVEGASSGNRFIGMYGEHQKIPIRTEAGSENFYDSTCSMGTPEIHPDSVVYGQSGQQNTRYARLGIAPIAAQKSLKGLWFFNEGFGTKILDHSGNKKHLTVVNPVWSENGRWGKTIELDTAKTTYINPIPLDTLDWTQPFTFAACVRISEDSRDNPLLAFRTSGASYSALFARSSIWSVVDYDGSTVQTSSASKMLKSPQDGYSWIVLYFDPANKTLTNLDTEQGMYLVSTPNAPRFSAWIAGISSVTLGFRDATGLGGSLSFVGFWQRRLNMPEVSDLVNMKVPNLYPSGAPMRIDNQPNNAINLQPTATNAEIISALNQLAFENNDLKDKMRSAGLMLS